MALDPVSPQHCTAIEMTEKEKANYVAGVEEEEAERKQTDLCWRNEHLVNSSWFNGDAVRLDDKQRMLINREKDSR